MSGGGDGGVSRGFRSGRRASPVSVGLLLTGDDGPDVADEESHGPEGTADIPGEGCWGDWVPSWSCLLSVGSAPEHCQSWSLGTVVYLLWFMLA